MLFRSPGADVAAIIQAHRRYLVELMQQWTRIKEDSDPADLNAGLAIDAELFRVDSVVRWLDAADGRIKRSAAPDAPVLRRSASPGSVSPESASPSSESPSSESPSSESPSSGSPGRPWPLPRLRGSARHEVRTEK